MKKLIYVFLTVLLFSLITFAQKISVSEVTELTNNNSGEFYFPKFSSDGTKVFFTHSNYKGLFYYKIADKSIVNVTDDNGAGYEFAVDDQSSAVYYRSDKYINGKKYSSLKACDLRSLKVKTIEADKRNLSTPKLLGNENVAYTIQNNLKSLDIKTYKQKSNLLSNSKPFVQIENCKMALYQNGKKKLLAPLGNGNYIWPSLSPDNSKILFTLAGKGTFISDLDGNILTKLGFADYPRWSPDGKWISFMADKDDGEKVISSDVYVASSDGAKKIQLTDSENVYEMYPEWSPAGNDLVVNTDDGKILLLKLKFEK